MRFNEGDNWDLRFTIKDRRVFELYLTYRIRRSFCPRKIPLVSKIEATRNFAIELGIFQSWKKFGRATARSEPPNSCLPTRTQRSGVRAQRGRSEQSERRSFLTAENPIGAVVFANAI